MVGRALRCPQEGAQGLCRSGKPRASLSQGAWPPRSQAPALPCPPLVSVSGVTLVRPVGLCIVYTLPSPLPTMMEMPLLKVLAKGKYLAAYFFGDFRERMYYLMQLYTSYSEFAKIHTDVKGWIWNLLYQLSGEISRQLLPRQTAGGCHAVYSQMLVHFLISEHS